MKVPKGGAERTLKVGKLGIPSERAEAYRGGMEFRLLGPLEVSDGERTLPIGGPKQRTVLARLLLQANGVVTVDRLIDATWGDDPPETARNTVQAYVHNLRKALGAERIQYRSSGYVLTADAGDVDALRFEALVAEAGRVAAAHPSGAVETLREALGLWRGPALDDLAEQAALQPEIARLEELRMVALEERIGAELALGRHRELVPELETLIRRYPFREGLWGHLMVALYRAGRQGDALAAYRRAREVLAEELGIDPSPDLQRLQEQILRQDIALELAGEPLRGYRLLELIGEGAFGAVHRALQPEVGREVAVKIIRPELANHPEFIRRFESEAQLVARLEHPHIVPVYDYWREPDGAYLVVRYLRGGSLREALAHGPLEADRVVQLIDQVALALAAAHRQGVVHRDVKPANILFDEEANAYLSDFGIAKDLAAAEVGGGYTTSPFASYLSPEEARGESVTPRADIYSLGVVLHEALAGRHPFADTPPDALAGKHARAPVPAIRSVCPDLPAALDEVIGRATAKDPEERYAHSEAFATAVRDALAPARTGPVAVAPLEVRNPYKGLRPFLEADAADFFGMDALTERLVALMEQGGELSGFLAVVGPSGSGKSSVVRAGLVPALRRGALPGSDRWFVATMHPGAHPFEELEAVLMRIAVDPPPGLADRIERDEHGLLEATEEILPPDASVLLVVIDQFEEVFTLVGEEEERRRFLATLLAAATDPRSRVRVLVTLRADFYDRPLSYRGFGDLLAGRSQAIAPLSLDELERAVSGPAEGVGVAVEPRLAAEIVAEVADQPGGLPLLQYALTELFERRENATLTLEAYHEIGGVSGALARRAEDLYGGLNQGGKEATRQLFLRLVSLGEERSEDTRRRVLRAELTSLGVDRETMETVIDTLGARRLLSFDRDPATRAPTVEVAHEALLSEWRRLAQWMNRHRADLLRHHSFATAVSVWEAHGRDPDYLLTGSRLAEFEEWGQTTTLQLAERERQFLDASLERRRQEQAREVQRLEQQRRLERRARNRLWALAAAVVLLAAAAVYGGLALLGSRPPDIVLVHGGVADEGFSDMIEAGFDRAASSLDIESEKTLPEVSLETTLRRLAEAGVPLIVLGYGAEAVDPVDAVAADFPDTRFIALDYPGDRPNVSYLTFAEEEGSFLVGAAAALKSETGIIGFIGGVDVEGIWRFQAGYEAGATAVDPEIQVLARYLTEPPDFSGWGSPTLGAHAANELYGEGADVIYHAAGLSGVGLFQVASARSGEEGRYLWGIGVDTDEYRSLPLLQESLGELDGAAWQPHVLTSMVKRIDRAIHAALEDYSRGNFIPGVREFDLAAGGVDIAYSGGFIDDIRPVIEDLRRQIIAGEIEVPVVPADKAGTPAL